MDERTDDEVFTPGSSSVRRKYHGGNSTLVPLVETVGPFPPGFTSFSGRA